VENLIISAAMLCCVLSITTVICLPGVALSLALYRRDPRGIHLRAVVTAGANALLCGVAFAVPLFLLGASVGDESAGDIAIMLGKAGLIGGAICAFVITVASMELVGWRIRSRAKEPAGAAPESLR